jgi:hypothetical protein
VPDRAATVSVEIDGKAVGAALDAYAPAVLPSGPIEVSIGLELTKDSTDPVHRDRDEQRLLGPRIRRRLPRTSGREGAAPSRSRPADQLGTEGAQSGET